MFRAVGWSGLRVVFMSEIVDTHGDGIGLIMPPERDMIIDPGIDRALEAQGIAPERADH